MLAVVDQLLSAEGHLGLEDRRSLIWEEELLNEVVAQLVWLQEEKTTIGIVWEREIDKNIDTTLIPLTCFSSLTSGSFCLVSFSESLTSCLRKPPGRADRGGGGTAVATGVFSSFICGFING